MKGNGLKMDKEIWKEFYYKNTRYEISNYGKIKTFYKCPEGRLLAIKKDKIGYLRTQLSSNNKSKQFLVHRLVAQLFVANPNNYNEINHIDGNKQNNYYENLEWCTHSHNIKHSFETGLKVNKKGSEHPLSKSFYQFDKNGKLIAYWGSLTECANVLAGSNANEEKKHSIRTNLTNCLQGRHKTLNGYIFSFKPDIYLDDYVWEKAKNPIIAIDKNTGETIEFLNFHEAERTILPNGKKPIATIICKVCKGKRESHAGYYWKYK